MCKRLCRPSAEVRQLCNRPSKPSTEESCVTPVQTIRCTMPRKERKRKEEHKKEEKREKKVQKIIPFKAKKREEREEKQEKKVQSTIPFEGKAKKEEGKEEKQDKRVQRIPETQPLALAHGQKEIRHYGGPPTPSS